MLLQCDEGVADEVGGGFMACIEDEDAVLQEFGLELTRPWPATDG
jgi:hypothetical protein